MAVQSFNIQELGKWIDRVLAEHVGRYRIQDEIFSADTVRVVGPRDQNFPVTIERWTDMPDAEGHERLERDLRQWAALAFDQCV